MDDQKLRDKLASEYCAHDINRDRSSFRLGWDAARANPQPLKDAINMLNAIEELTKECEQLRAELSRQEKLALNEFSRWETAQKERDQLKAENTELKARNWVLQDKSLRTYDGLTTECDQLRAAAEKLAEALEAKLGPITNFVQVEQDAKDALVEYREKFPKEEKMSRQQKPARPFESYAWNEAPPDYSRWCDASEAEAAYDDLAKECEQIHVSNENLKKRYLELKQVTEKFAEALEFYASNWRSDVYVGPTEDLISDSGQKANDALAKYRAKYEKKKE